VGELGEGSFGMVNKVKSSKGMMAAAKVIPVKYDEELEDFVVEVDILATCKHAGLVGLVGAHLWKDNLWVLLELCEGGAMDDILIELEQGFAEDQIRCLANQMVGCLQYLHSKMVIHRDLKAGNVLLKADGTCKLTDFGVSALNAKMEQKRSTFIGTPYWMAPEVVICENNQDKPYTYSADIWSLGITMIEFAETSPPWHDMHPMRVLFKIPKSPSPTLTDMARWSDDFHGFLEVCLAKEPSERETASGLLPHPFISGNADKRPLRDLFKLVKADVVETIQDAPTLGGVTAGSAGSSGSMVINAGLPAAPAGGFNNPTSSAEILAAELAAASLEQGSLLKETDHTKNYKTLTRTRQYVNEEGEVVTVTTERLVETSVKSGKMMTIRQGMVNIDRDWKDAEAKRLALLRKEQLRETKLVQREEQKECSELIEKLKIERDGMGARHGKTVDELEKDHTKAVAAAQKAAKGEKEKLEKTLAKDLVAETKKINAAGVATLKAAKVERAAQLKQTLKDMDELPAEDRKSEKKAAQEGAATKHVAEEAALKEKVAQDTAVAIKAAEAKNTAELAERERNLLAAEHELGRENRMAMRRLAEAQLQETQQTLKHQLKATFWMQKHQMHYRHEKESDQLRRLQEKKIANLKAKLSEDEKSLPKKQRVATKKGKSAIERTASKSEKATKLKEFEEQELHRMGGEQKALSANYAAALETLSESTQEESAELIEMQNMKKQTLMGNEVQKLAELEHRHAEEIAVFETAQDEISGKLEDDFASQLDAHAAFYA
jgi:serine/threonine protein kinase